MGKISEGTKNVGSNIPIEMYHELKSAADASHMSIGKYIRLLLKDCLAEGKGYRLEPISHDLKAAEEPPKKGYRKPGKRDTIPGRNAH